MIPVSFYTPLFYHGMLVVVLACAILYGLGQSQARIFPQLNKWLMIVLGLGLILFVGFRPINGLYFVDMGDYARAYERVQEGGAARYPDALFNRLMDLCSPVLPASGFFVVCALIYIAPVAAAFCRVHRSWSFPVFLACLTAFSFWGYGVNGIRNGMATSVLILAFAFHDRPLVMLPLMGAAWGFHGGTLLPAVAFLFVRYLKWTEIWLVFWFMCVAISLLAGNVGEFLLSRYNPLAWDNRIESYIAGSETGGFRVDFLLYSIVPVLVTLFMASPTGPRSDTYLPRGSKLRRRHSILKHGSLAAVSMGMEKLLLVQQSDVALASISSHAVRIPAESRFAMEATSGKANRQVRTRRKPQIGLGGWASLPWIRLLRMDLFYARLVNTYLLANAVWVLVIQSNFSNRFAYLSWFMLPWVIIYPFVPGKFVDRPRLLPLAATLCAQYMFTYVMGVVVYPLRSIG